MEALFIPPMKTLLKYFLVLLLSAPCVTRSSDSIGAQLLAKAGMKRGVCSVLGITGNIPLEIAEAGEMLVHVRDPQTKSIYAQRQAAANLGFGLDRFTAETGSLTKLPFADNSAAPWQSPPRALRRAGAMEDFGRTDMVHLSETSDERRGRLVALGEGTG